MKVGIKSKFKEDVAVVTFKDYANVASVTTKSKTCAANISWLKKIKKMERLKHYLLIQETLMPIQEKLVMKM